jgi:hypothetical protein
MNICYQLLCNQYISFYLAILGLIDEDRPNQLTMFPRTVISRDQCATRASLSDGGMATETYPARRLPAAALRLQPRRRGV